MQACILCNRKIVKNPIIDNGKSFCCYGCQTVFSILEAKNELKGFENHPVYLQALKSGLISNTEPKKDGSQGLDKKDLKRLHLEISGLWCPFCAELIQLVLKKEKGVYRCIVDYSVDFASIEFDPKEISKKAIINLIDKMGYSASLLQDPYKKQFDRVLQRKFFLAAFCTLNIMMLSYPVYISYFNQVTNNYISLFSWLSFIFFIPVAVFSASPIWKRLYLAIRYKKMGMESLVAMGVVSATTLSLYHLLTQNYHIYFDASALLITLVLLGKMIESKGKFSAKESLLRLHKAIPKKGRKKKEDGTFEFLPLKDFKVGDLAASFVGEKIFLDGKVVEGQGALDESVMTGESRPIKKSIGSDLIAGTTVQNGWFVYRVTKQFKNSSIYSIVDLIEQDLFKNKKQYRIVDKIIPFLAPFIVLLSLLTFVSCIVFQISDFQYSFIETGFLRATTVFMIACPCAIGIASPLAESQWIYLVASLGAIVRNRLALFHFAKPATYVFDKTGTITHGKYKVLKGVESLNSFDKEVLKTLSSYSNHHIAKAISASFEAKQLSIEKIEEYVGKGIKAIFHNHTYLLGSKDFLESCGVEVLEEKTCYTTVYFSKDKKLLTTLVLGDEIRKEAFAMIKNLKNSLKVLLSGDSEGVVSHIARICGFDRYFSSMTPLEKREFILSLQKDGKNVIMIGDGINDAPALTTADIGISVVNASDISIQVSDIFLTTPTLSKIHLLQRYAKKTVKIIRQNFFWAFFYNIIGVGMAISGQLTPIYSAVAMILSSSIVVLNSFRLKVRN